MQVRVIVREIVATAAEEELPLFDGLDEVDDATALRRLQRRPKREPLGFGVGEIVALVTPVLWLLLEKLAESAAEKAVDEASEQGAAWWRRRRRSRREPLELPPMSAEEIERAGAAVRLAFAESDLEEDKVEAVARAVETALTERSEGR